MSKKPGIIKRSLKSTVNVSRWIAWNEIKDHSKILKNLSKSVFAKPKKSLQIESFEETIARLNLTEKEIKEREKNFRNYALIFFGMGIALLVYMVYLIFSGHPFSGLFCIFLSSLAFANAYRMHFWYIQTKNRKFGLTFKDWARLTFKK